MLLYYSSLEEKFKVYREQQLLELKAQEDQLIQAMVARDPALAERFIEAKAEAKPEAKPEATKKEAKAEAKPEAEIVKGKRPTIDTRFSAEVKKPFGSSNSPLYFKELEMRVKDPKLRPTPSGPGKQKDDIPLAMPVEDKRRSDYRSKDEREKEIAELESKLSKGSFSKTDSDRLKKNISQKKENLRKFLSKEAKLYANVPVAEPLEQSANGLRTKRCKVHF